MTSKITEIIKMLQNAKCENMSENDNNTENYNNTEDYNNSENDNNSEDSNITQELGLIDYRGNNIIVKEGGENTFIVTLNFYFHLTNFEAEETIDVEEWCSLWDTDVVQEEFDNMYEVIESKWLKPAVFQMRIKKPIHFKSDTFYTIDEMINYLNSNSLEDGPYEASPGTFWVIPCNL